MRLVVISKGEFFIYFFFMQKNDLRLNLTATKCSQKQNKTLQIERSLSIQSEKHIIQLNSISTIGKK